MEKDKKEIDKIYKLENSINFYFQKEKIGNLLFKNLGLFRTESDMSILLSELIKIKENFFHMGIDDKSKIYNKNLVELLEFRNMIDIAILVCLSAISRKESRGSHFRLDYSIQNNEYEKSSFLIKNRNIEVKFEEAL